NPEGGMTAANEMLELNGKVAPGKADRVMLQVQKEKNTWQHVIPVSKGQFSFRLPLFFGKGIHDVHVLVPDENRENRFRFAATILADNQSDRMMEPIEYHREYEVRGVRLEKPSFGGEKADLIYEIKGKIDPLAPFAKETTHIYVKTEKGQDEALDIIPVQDYSFHGHIHLRFGRGEYKVTIHVPEPKEENTATFSFLSVASFHVTNTAQEDKRDLLPSRGIQSDSPKILALAKELAKGSKTDRDKALAIYEYTARNVSYDVKKYQDNGFEWDDSALKTLETGRGVCQDYAYLAAALLRASNIESRFISGQAGSGAKKENHAWIEAKLDGKWVTMDPTWGSGYVENGRFVSRYTADYFDPDPAVFNKTHIRDKPEY
ncbi:MAG TPA: transglutaminase-like domain-containing protein, partial [Bacillaceae bacterium]